MRRPAERRRGEQRCIPADFRQSVSDSTSNTLYVSQRLPRERLRRRAVQCLAEGKWRADVARRGGAMPYTLPLLVNVADAAHSVATRASKAQGVGALHPELLRVPTLIISTQLG